RAAPSEDRRRAVRVRIAVAGWVMDGNYGGTLALRLARADTVIFLDLPRAVCLWRVLRRQLRYRGQKRPDMAPGCPERMTWEFLRWIWSYPQTRRPAILTRLSALRSDQRAIVLTSPQMVRRFVEALPAPSLQ